MGVFTFRHIIIRPHRINLPSSRSQWRKYERGKGKISANEGAERADLFYADTLLIECIVYGMYDIIYYQYLY